jgi:hypothetical protein
MLTESADALAQKGTALVRLKCRAQRLGRVAELDGSALCDRRHVWRRCSLLSLSGTTERTETRNRPHHTTAYHLGGWQHDSPPAIQTVKIAAAAPS